MADRFRITLGQLNPTVGDLAGNAALAREAWEAGRDAGADLVALPEMFITGYNAQDLVMRRAFQLDVMSHIEALAAACPLDLHDSTFAVDAATRTVLGKAEIVLDRLAADGMAFDNHYVSTAICMASRKAASTI